MMIRVPRFVIVGLAGLFSSYHIVLAVYAMQFGYESSTAPVFMAIGLYAVVTLVVLSPRAPARMPVWEALSAVAVAVLLPLLVTSVLDPGREGGNGYATWYVAAVGTLMTITATRRRPVFAWVGVAFLFVQTVLWGGLGALGSLGVLGSAAWVAVSHIITSSLAKAARDSQRFALAEREATEWQAAQEAHLNERQFRLGQTSIMALPILQTIRQSGGDLSAAERAECLHLEGAIRDEIRGRRLLNDRVRDQVMLARRRGTMVTLLDEGGLDDLEDAELDRVLDQLAEALRETTADKVIARTVPEGSEVAVTVVGLRSDSEGSLLGHDGDDEVELWMEIPRTEPAAP